MNTEFYISASSKWPSSGRHILARYDEESITVYQAYNPTIAGYAVKHQKFGGEFSYSRMSWIKPNFLWMMYRSGWATKEGQERVLAITLMRTFFDSILTQAVPSAYDAKRYSTHAEWQAAVSISDVRLQWDPDHDPHGRPLDRRAIQLGLRGSTLRLFGEQEPLSIEDITPFVAEQRGHLKALDMLLVPKENVYTPSEAAARAAGVDESMRGSNEVTG